MKKNIITYQLELIDIKENELPESDIEEIKEFNKMINLKYGLENISVLVNDNLLYEGRLFANTKQECNALLTLLIGELKSYYKKYKIKNVSKKLIMYGKLI